MNKVNPKRVIIGYVYLPFANMLFFVMPKNEFMFKIWKIVPSIRSTGNKVVGAKIKVIII